MKFLLATQLQGHIFECFSSNRRLCYNVVLRKQSAAVTMEIILNGVNPTTFNLVASLLAEMLQLAGAFTLCALLHLWVSIFLQNGHTVPVNALGPLPDSLVSALHYARAMKWAWPATIGLFLFISDYSTAIAFAGLDFDFVDEMGAEAPVLNLAKRNDYFPYEAMGDPVLPATASKLELLLESSSSISQDRKGELVQLGIKERTVSSFLGAADAIARGESVFLDHNEEIANDPTLLLVGQRDQGLFEGMEDTTVLYGTKNLLAGIDLAIPLDCFDDDMVTIKGEHGQDQERVILSQVPNCTFTSARPSGIYGQDESFKERAEVTAFVRIGSKAGTKLFFQGKINQPIEDGAAFPFPFNGIPLALERENFREGRQVFGFGGLQISDRHIPFGLTVVSHGNIRPESPLPDVTNTLVTPIAREYKLIAEVKDQEKNCPEDPSGAEDSACMVTAKVTCHRFQTEYGIGGLLHSSGEGPFFEDIHDHYCIFDGEVEIIWGKNFDIDPQLLAVVAGIQARNSGWALSYRQRIVLSVHSIPAALFVLGVLDSSTSVQQIRSTKINGIFIAFMCLPACICVISGAMYLIGQKYLILLPDEGKRLIELAAAFAKQQEEMPNKLSSLGLSWNGEHLILSKKEAKKPCTGWQEYLFGHESAVALDQHKLSEEKCIVDVNAQDSLETNNACNTTNGSRDGNINDSQGDCETGRYDNLGPTRLPSQDSTKICCHSTNSTGMYVAACMFFCVALAAIATVLFTERNVGLEDSLKGPSRQWDGPQQLKYIEESFIPEGCFRTKFELGTSIWQYSHGSDQERSQLVQSYGPPQDWCVGFVDDFSFLFAAVDTFSLWNFSVWNVSSCTRFDYSFFRYVFAQDDIDLSKWDVSRAKSFQGMFAESNFNGNILLWDVSSATNFAGMFDHAKAFSHSLTKWDVSSGTDFGFMFGSTRIGEADISKWNVSSGVKFNAMFFGASSFNSNLSQWDVSSGTDFKYMFFGATDFDGDLSGWDLSSGINFGHMFHAAQNFNSDISKWNVSASSNFGYMLSGTYSFESDLSQWNVSSGQNFASMFSSSKTFNSDLSRWDVSKGTDFDFMFQDAASFNSDIGRWDVSSGNSFRRMFNRASIFNSDLSQWNVSASNEFGYMFSGATNFNNNLCEWQQYFSSATFTKSMFAGTQCPVVEYTTYSVCQACFPTMAPSRLRTLPPLEISPTPAPIPFLFATLAPPDLPPPENFDGLGN